MERRRLGAVVAAAAVPLALWVVPAPAAAAAPPGPHPCAGAVERCDGEIEVPLDWDDPSSERITVGFAVVPRRDMSRPATGTILANLGGPGEVIRTIPLLQEILGPVLDHQDLVAIDPRGIGRSTPLLCPDIDTRDQARLEACIDQLGGQRLAFFTSRQFADDIDAVRRALGIDQFTVYGNSYGTIFGQALVSRHPDAVRAVFFDSAFAPDPTGYLKDLSYAIRIPEQLQMVGSACQASPSCRHVPGEAVDRWADLVRTLSAHPDPVVRPHDLLDDIQRLFDDPVLAREANAAATAYLAGDPLPLRRLTNAVDSVVPPDEARDFQRPNLPGLLTYFCTDFTYRYDRDAAPDVRRQQLAEFYATEPFTPFTVADMRNWNGRDADLGDTCTAWPTRDAPVVPPDAQYPDIPAVVINGQFDGGALPEYAGDVASRFPHGTAVVAPFGGHANTVGDGPYADCVRNQMLRPFLEHPDTPLVDPGCTKENFRAPGTFPRRTTDLVRTAFATAADALARRNPNGLVYTFLTEEPGLRGGLIRFDDAASTVRLDQVRFVDNMVVSGQVRAGAADLQVTPDGGTTRHVTLTWRPFVAEDRTLVTGTLDGRPLRIRVPVP